MWVTIHQYSVSSLTQGSLMPLISHVSIQEWLQFLSMYRLAHRLLSWEINLWIFERCKSHQEGRIIYHSDRTNLISEKYRVESQIYLAVVTVSHFRVSLVPLRFSQGKKDAIWVYLFFIPGIAYKEVMVTRHLCLCMHASVTQTSFILTTEAVKWPITDIVDLEHPLAWACFCTNEEPGFCYCLEMFVT